MRQRRLVGTGVCRDDASAVPPLDRRSPRGTLAARAALHDRVLCAGRGLDVADGMGFPNLPQALPAVSGIGRHALGRMESRGPGESGDSCRGGSRHACTGPRFCATGIVRPDRGCKRPAFVKRRNRPRAAARPDQSREPTCSWRSGRQHHWSDGHSNQRELAPAGSPGRKLSLHRFCHVTASTFAGRISSANRTECRYGAEFRNGAEHGRGRRRRI